MLRTTNGDLPMWTIFGHFESGGDKGSGQHMQEDQSISEISGTCSMKERASPHMESEFNIIRV